MKKLFPVAITNKNRAKAGSLQGLAGREYPLLVATRLLQDTKFRKEVCRVLNKSANDLVGVEAGASLNKNVASVVERQKTPSKTTLRLLWRDGNCTNFIVKKSAPAQICLKKVGAFISEFQAQFKKKIPTRVQEALALFVGEHPKQKEILESISVNFVGDEIRDLERAYNNRLTLASMYGYDLEMADALLNWLRENTAELIAFCFSRGAAKNACDFAEYLWYHSSNEADSNYQIIDLKKLIGQIKKIPKKDLALLVGAQDAAKVGSTISLPFGNLQYHEHSLQFRHDYKRIKALLEWKTEKKCFGSRQKESGHKNELLVASALNKDKQFLAHFCSRVGHAVSEFVCAEAGGKNAKKVSSILGGKTQGKTDVSVLWKDGTYTNISLKKNPAGQVYLVTAKNFVNAYEAQYKTIVPSKVRRALAFFIGEDPESRAILEATDIAVDGKKARELAYEQNYRLMFAVIKNYDPRMASELLVFLHKQLANVFELCFSAGAVEDRSLWSNVLWYRNLVDAESQGLNYLVSIPVVKAAIERHLKRLVVEPGKEPGSTIQLPFGHLQYHLKQLEFYQKLQKIQSLISLK